MLTGRENVLQICHAMASPSLSSSAASKTFLADFMAWRSFVICGFLLSSAVYVGWKSLETSIDSNPCKVRI